MHTSRVAAIALSVVLLTVVAGAEEPTLHNTEIYQSPWAGETPSKGTVSVRHEGMGEPPEKGYFKEHEPGEVAEFHLFVPDGLTADDKVPLLIVYHGGKDGASGKGMLGGFSKLSTVEHPVIVLSPNMYTMDAMNELLDEGQLPIDPRRVVVYGHSSGGMGVLSAMKEYVRTNGAFVPAALMAASTTASFGRGKYPPCTYYVMAGEKETPEFVKSAILRERRRTCRIHSLQMQQVFQDIRYIEIKDSGHSGGTPAHKAIIQHALAVSERAPVEMDVTSESSDVEILVAAAREGDWKSVHEEFDQLDDSPALDDAAEYARVRTAVLHGLERWFGAEVRAIAALAPDASYVDRDRAFARYDRCVAVAADFDDTSSAKTLAVMLASLSDAQHWSAEIAARDAYREIVSKPPNSAMRNALEELRASSPGTEFGRNRTREKLLALQELPPDPADLPEGPEIQNPYFARAKWRVWRDDPTPIPNVRTLVHEGKEKVPTSITLQPTPAAERIYPEGPRMDGAPIKYVTSATPSGRFSGVWDDVYASWSGLHGYVRPTYQTTDGSSVQLRPKAGDQIMHFVEVRKTQDLLRCGINFVHQSTTGMAHTITNGYSVNMTQSYERIYFSDCLVTSPAHATFTEDKSDRTTDLYLALVPTLFNSVGSSNSETMAITKMMIVGGYLPPDTKRILKQSGLYPAALLYMWKASLPYDVPYAHELRQRVAYRALGDEQQYVGKYGHAGSERGNMSLQFHKYDEIAHMRNMIAMAQTMTVPPPEAILDKIEVTGGKQVYGLKKAALILQEPDQEITIKLSSAASYDLAGRPLTVRWKLLYGNHATTCEPGDEEGSWVIRVPWDATLPEGRTALALVANNGEYDSNPAIVNIFRKFQDIPPNGQSPGGYAYNPPTANRRPVILDLQDRIVTPGETVRIALRAVDPEGQPVRFYKRAGEPGELDGNLFTFKVPSGADATHTVTFMASDATAGNSYSAKQIHFETRPEVFAHIATKAHTLVGAAPFTVEVSSKGSSASGGKLELGWEFYLPTSKRKADAWKTMTHGNTATHTFEKPGLYEVALTARSGEVSDRETLSVWVTKGAPPRALGGVVVEGNGARIADGDEVASAFDHTDFGTVDDSGAVTREFELISRGEDDLSCSSRTVEISGDHASEFKVTRAPRNTIEAGGYGTFAIEFRPRGGGARKATVTVTAGDSKIRFAIAGKASQDQAQIDAGAAGPWKAAKSLADARKWTAAETALAKFIDEWPGATVTPEAAQLLERIRTDPEILKEIAATADAVAAKRDLAQQCKRAKSLLSMAENSLSAGRKDLATQYWKEIIDKYPDTPQAAEARRLLGR